MGRLVGGGQREGRLRTAHVAAAAIAIGAAQLPCSGERKVSARSAQGQRKVNARSARRVHQWPNDLLAWVAAAFSASAGFALPR